VWWDWPSWVTYGIIGIVAVTSPIQWFVDERKRSRKLREAAGDLRGDRLTINRFTG
jgi:hypothetical protein